MSDCVKPIHTVTGTARTALFKVKLMYAIKLVFKLYIYPKLFFFWLEQKNFRTSVSFFFLSTVGNIFLHFL